MSEKDDQESNNDGLITSPYEGYFYEVRKIPSPPFNKKNFFELNVSFTSLLDRFVSKQVLRSSITNMEK
jgi:hypothetical protein